MKRGRFSERLSPADGIGRGGSECSTERRVYSKARGGVSAGRTGGRFLCVTDSRMGAGASGHRARAAGLYIGVTG